MCAAAKIKSKKRQKETEEHRMWRGRFDAILQARQFYFGIFFIQLFVFIKLECV